MTAGRSIILIMILAGNIRAEKVVIQPDRILTVDQNNKIIKDNNFFSVGNSSKKKKLESRRAFIDFDIAGIVKNKTIKNASLSVSFVSEKSLPYGSAYFYNILEKWDRKKPKFEHKSERISMILLKDEKSGLKTFDLTPFFKEYTTASKKHFGFYIRGEERGTKTMKYFKCSKSDKTMPSLTIEYAANLTAENAGKSIQNNLKMTRDGDNFEWVVKHEKNIKEFCIYNAETEKLLIKTPAVGADFYSITVPKSIKIKLTVVKKDETIIQYNP